MKKVKDFMNKEVVYFSPEDSIFDAAKIFAELNISGAPVVENEKVVGIISVSDIIKFIDIKLGTLPRIDTPGVSSLLLTIAKLEKHNLDFKKEIKKITKTKIKHVMTKNVITVSPSASLVEVAEIMEKKDVNRLPVIARGKLVGIVTRADLIRALIV